MANNDSGPNDTETSSKQKGTSVSKKSNEKSTCPQAVEIPNSRLSKEETKSECLISEIKQLKLDLEAEISLFNDKINIPNSNTIKRTLKRFRNIIGRLKCLQTPKKWVKSLLH